MKKISPMAPVCDKIFREYDIRGVVGSQITPDTAFDVGRAFGSTVRKQGGNSICLGRDGRLSSPELAARLVQGLLTTGLQVKDVGIGPTPYAHYASRHLNTDAMIMVTGSHNPGDQNGFKMALHHQAFWGQEVQDLKKRIQLQNYTHGLGTYEERDLLSVYVRFLVDDFAAHYPQAKALKVAWDPGNGAAGYATSLLIKNLPGEHFLINETIDGAFPAHHPDPTVAKNLVQLQSLVQENACDLGIAFDGDGDRIGVVDGDGRILWGDDIMELFAKEVLDNHPGTCIIADVKASDHLFDAVRAMGGNALMWKTGHSLIKTKMRETGALLAGELSGHIFFADRYFGYDDALYAALRLLGICSSGQQSLTQWSRARPERFSTPELRFVCEAQNRFEVVKRISETVRDQGLMVDETDGVRVRGENGWWLLRASNTQDVLVARAEATSCAHLEDFLTLITRLLLKEGVSFDAQS